MIINYILIVIHKYHMVEVVHLIIYDTSAPWMFYHSTLHDMSGVIGLARRAWNFSMPALFGKTSKNNTGCWTILCLSVSIVYIPIYLYLGLGSWVDCACDFTKSPANGSSICNILKYVICSIYMYRYVCVYPPKCMVIAENINIMSSLVTHVWAILVYRRYFCLLYGINRKKWSIGPTCEESLVANGAPNHWSLTCCPLL